MPLYKIHLTQRVIETASLNIEAADPNAAADLAHRKVNSGEIEWHFYEAPETPTIEEIKEI